MRTNKINGLADYRQKSSTPKGAVKARSKIPIITFVCLLSDSVRRVGLRL
jgi:hypothetical protein